MYWRSDDYRIDHPEQILSPGVIVFRQWVAHNLNTMLRVAGDPQRLRPHVKTHKIREIVRWQLDLGITRHKCATIAEAEMLAQVGAPDVLIAYQMVGPNVRRLLHLIDRYPATKFMALTDNPAAALQTADAAQAAGAIVRLMLDLNPGMDRTGIAPDSRAIELYELISSQPGLQAAGLHWYDGHHRQPDIRQRRIAVLAGWEQLTSFRDKLLLSGLEVPRVVAAGSGSFPILAEVGEPDLELSPGTTTFYDADYCSRFTESDFRPALALFTRVISHSGDGRVTFDVGHKACAADPPAGARLWFPEIPDAVELQHSEEHLVVETSAAERLNIGDWVLAIPRHACPTVALHQSATVIENGAIVDRWEVAARNRVLSI